MITGGEPTLRSDIEEIVHAARLECKFRSVLLITNGTLLDRKAGVLSGVTGLVVSLDALASDPTNPLSKPAALPKVMENLEFAKERLGSARRITISTVIEEWNIGEVERLLDWCGEQGFERVGWRAEDTEKTRRGRRFFYRGGRGRLPEICGDWGGWR